MLRLVDVRKSYLSGTDRLQVLRGVTMELARGEVAALMGPSGVGKSTLLHLVAGLDRPDSGAIEVAGERVTRLREGAMDQFRLRTVGVVYQFHFLLPEFTALENTLLPALVAGASPSAARRRASDLLDEVGLTPRAAHVPAKLSGGEQQRVAIARALMNEPQLLLADEPTGNLDEESAAQVFALMKDLQRRRGLSVLMATHNPALAGACDRIVRLRDGQVSPPEPA